MAIYHLHVSKISRGEGRSATAAAAYRSGEKIRDERTRETHDYTKKKGIESKELVLPGGGKEERAAFWNGVELHHKRGDAIVAREIEVSLPAELSKFQRKELAVRYARELAERYGVAADVAIHQPSRKGDQRNHHAHIMLSACQVSREGALGKKAVELDPIHCQRHKIETLVERERPRWAELVNKELERNREKSRIDHRTLKAQGIERAPTQHLGPSATAIERKAGQLSRITQEQDQQLQRLEQARLAREEAKRTRELEQRQREKEQQEKAAQEKAQQQREQAAKAQELAEKQRLEREQELKKAAPKTPEPARMPPRAVAWRGPSSKPALPKPPENIERQTKDQEQLRKAQEEAEQRQREQQERAQEEQRAREAAEKERQEKAAREREEKAAQERAAAEQARKESQAQEARRQAEQKSAEKEQALPTREELLAKARAVTDKRRQELAQEAAKAAITPKTQERAEVPAQAKPREQRVEPSPATIEPSKPLDVAAGMAAAKERFGQMRAQEDRAKAEQERAQKQKEQEQKKDRGRGGPER